MSSRRITIRVDAELEAQIEQAARREGLNTSSFVREALARGLRSGKPRKKPTAFELAEKIGFIGAAKGLPKDLATNKKYFKGFGR